MTCVWVRVKRPGCEAERFTTRKRLRNLSVVSSGKNHIGVKNGFTGLSANRKCICHKGVNNAGIALRKRMDGGQGSLINDRGGTAGC